MDIQIERAVAYALEKRANLLEEVIKNGNEESAINAATELALLGTEQATAILLKLIREADKNLVRQDILTGAFIRFSPCRKTHKKMLLSIFTDDRRKAVLAAYADLGELHPLLLGLPPLHEDIQKAYEWVNDDSGD